MFVVFLPCSQPCLAIILAANLPYFAWGEDSDDIVEVEVEGGVDKAGASVVTVGVMHVVSVVVVVKMKNKVKKLKSSNLE